MYIRNMKGLLVFLIFLWVTPSAVRAQQWSGILSSSRAIDWSTAGVPGGIPNRTSICATLSPGATATQINNAIASCPAGQVVLLNAGTYNLTSGIIFNNKSNVTLRGAGPDQTFLKFTAGNGCGGWGGDVCIINADPDCAGCGSPSNVSNWTGGYSQGTSVITLSSQITGSVSPAVGQMIFLDQADDSTTDTGQVWICQTASACTQQNGSQNGRPGRGQQQPVMVTAVSGSGPYTVTITPGIRMPNWSSSKSPQAWWSNSLPVSGVGIESLSIDNSSTALTGSIMAGVMVINGYGNWIRNVRDINSPHEHVMLYQSAHNTVQDSYFYGSFSAASQSYGADIYNGADNLIVNNIFQHIAQSMMTEGCVGCVFAYNHTLDDWYINGDAQWQEPSSWGHSVGDSYILWESNNGIGLISDDIHGGRHFISAYRNYWTGYDPAGGSSGGKTEQTTPIILEANSRYFNLIGNVLGTPSLHTNYQVSPSSTTDPGSISTTNQSIYSFGYSGNQGTYVSPIPNDMTQISTLMRWGNYDTASGTARFVSSEVPTALSLLSNILPASQSLPASFVFTGRPSWWSTPWGTPSWPAIGPDVTGGNIAGLGGHASMVPATLCYLNSPTDSNYPGTADRGVLLFNASACYSSPTGGTPPAPPTNLSVVVQ